MKDVRIGSQTVSPSEVLTSYWTFAAERQRVYFARLAGEAAPWTDDPVISQYRFTNAYRAADRVSQDLIRVIASGPQAAEDVVLRVLLYRFFNKPTTWSALESSLGQPVQWQSFSEEPLASVLDGMLARGERVYSAAYIVPPPPFGAERKHRNHLRLVEHMMRDGLARRLSTASSLGGVFELLASYPSLGPFLAYQLTVDLNYTNVIDFDEDDFVVAGPGARSGIAKCFPGATLAAEDIIRWMVDTQEEQLEALGLDFEPLFGRRLKLIDCQNLFCETDKYARVMHPNFAGRGGRTKIKQQFAAAGPLEVPMFPTKWGLADAVRRRIAQVSAPSWPRSLAPLTAQRETTDRPRRRDFELVGARLT